MNVEHVHRPPLEQLALSRQVQVLAGVDENVRHRLGYRSQPVEVVAKARVLDPIERNAGVVECMQPADRLLGCPRLVGIGHQQALASDGFLYEPESSNVPLQVRVTDLDLERREARSPRAGVEVDDLLVGEMELEPTGVGRHPLTLASEQPVERQPEDLALDVPHGLLDARGEDRCPDPSAARAFEAVDPGERARTDDLFGKLGSNRA